MRQSSFQREPSLGYLDVHCKVPAIFSAMCEFLGLGDSAECRGGPPWSLGFAVGLLTLADQSQTGERFGFQSVPKACAKDLGTNGQRFIILA